LPELFDGLQGFIVISPVHAERLMKNTVLVEGIAIDGSGTLEEDDIVVAAAKAVEPLRHAVNRESIRVFWIAADAAQIFHAQYIGVESLGAIQVIHRYAHVIDLL